MGFNHLYYIKPTITKQKIKIFDFSQNREDRVIKIDFGHSDDRKEMKQIFNETKMFKG
jgi:hypothetical protein